MARTAPEPPGSRLPLVAAPMAGGPTTPRLAAAVAEAGAFAFLAGAFALLAGGYKTPEALAAQIAPVRRHGAAFGVNLFAPNLCPIDEAEFRRYAHELQADADRYGLDLSRAPLLEDDNRWTDELDLLLADPVPVVSVTFGLPRPAEVAGLRRAGSRVLMTVTTVAEARAAADVGADALVVQGSDAGGHLEAMPRSPSTSSQTAPSRSCAPSSTRSLKRWSKRSAYPARSLPHPHRARTAPAGGTRHRTRADQDRVPGGPAVRRSSAAGSGRAAALPAPRHRAGIGERPVARRPDRQHRERCGRLVLPRRRCPVPHRRPPGAGLTSRTCSRDRRGSPRRSPTAHTARPTEDT